MLQVVSDLSWPQLRLSSTLFSTAQNCHSRDLEGKELISLQKPQIANKVSQTLFHSQC